MVCKSSAVVVSVTGMAAISALLQGGARSNSSNELVSDFTAQSIAAIYTCVRILSTAVATLPCKIYKTAQTGSKQEDVSNPLHRILTLEPTRTPAHFQCLKLSWFTPQFAGMVTWRFNAMVQEQLLRFRIWTQELTEPVMLPNNQLAYKTTDGETAGEHRIIPARNVVHNLWNSWRGGVVGQSPIMALRETLGLAISMQKFQGQSMTNDGAPGLILTNNSPLPMSPTDGHTARADLEALTTGSNRRRAIILDQQMKLEPLGFNSADLDLLAQKKWTTQEIAAAYMIHFTCWETARSYRDRTQPTISHVHSKLPASTSRGLSKMS